MTHEVLRAGGEDENTCFDGALVETTMMKRIQELNSEAELSSPGLNAHSLSSTAYP